MASFLFPSVIEYDEQEEEQHGMPVPTATRQANMFQLDYQSYPKIRVEILSGILCHQSEFPLEFKLQSGYGRLWSVHSIG
jgi:hypothetical protein